MRDHIGCVIAEIGLKSGLLLATFGSAGVFLIAVIAWVGDLAVWCSHKRDFGLANREAALHIVVRFFCALDLGLIVAWAILAINGRLAGWPRFEFWPLSGTPDQTHYSDLLRALTSFSALGVLPGVYGSYRTWLNPRSTVGSRFQEGSIAVAFLVFDMLLIASSRI
jgi:hypothetical protein